MQEIPQTFFEEGVFLSLDAETVLIGYGKLSVCNEPSASSPSFYAPDFFLNSATPWFCPTVVKEVSKKDFIKFVEDRCPPQGKIRWTPPVLASLEEQLHSLDSFFSAGKLVKGVPVVFEEAPLEPQFYRRALAHLLKEKSELFLYGFWTKEEGMLGATPERLLESTDARCFHTMALAGTRSVSGPLADASLKSDPKEWREHQIVVEDIVQSLAPYGKIHVGPTEIVTVPHLQHLRTEIQLQSEKKVSPLKLVHSLHPTAALGTFPKKEGIEWLQRLQKQQDRRRFGAPFGVVWPEGRVSLVAAIRNVQWDQKRIYLGAGCGVMPGYDLQQEWRELEWKRTAVKRMMGL